MKKILETERLLLREFTHNDSRFIIELLNTAGWLKNIGDRNVRTDEEAKCYLDNGPIKSYRDNGFGLYLVALKDTGRPIGMCGFIKRPDLEDIDIGFAFLPDVARRGYAYEIAKATLQYGFEIMKFKSVVGITLPSNESSIKLLEKLGMRLEKEIIKDDKNLLLLGICVDDYKTLKNLT